MKIKSKKPKVTTTIRPSRAVRRLVKNPTYIPVNLGCIADYIFLCIISATMTMSGLTFGACIRVVGL